MAQASPTTTVPCKSENRNTHVTLKVQSQKEHDFVFRTRRDLPLRHVMLEYGVLVGIDNYLAIRFHYDDKRIRGHQAANDLEMEDGDVIDAWADQHGGGTSTLPSIASAVKN